MMDRDDFYAVLKALGIAAAVIVIGLFFWLGVGGQGGEDGGSDDIAPTTVTVPAP